jgi:hypothetical protein
MLEHKIKYKYMRRELEEELKNECFLSQMKRERLKDMEDFFDNEDWSFEKDENENMIFYIDYDIYDDEFIEESIFEMINQFGNYEITEITYDSNECGDEFTKVSTTLPFELFSYEFF